MANTPIKPWELPAGVPVANASIVGGNGAVVEKYTPAQIVDVAVPLASQGDAETGTGNDNRMSALRVKQAIDAQANNIAITQGGGYASGSVGEKLNRIVYVTDAPFNAVPNDSTTDQAVLNLAAFNAAIEFVYNQGGGVVRVPPGLFYVCRKPTPTTHEERYIRLRPGVHLIGDGMDSTHIVRAGPTSLFNNAPTTDSSYTLNGGGYRVADMTLDANSVNYFYAANQMYWGSCNNISIERVRFLNIAGLHALDLNNVKSMLVSNCRFEGHNTALTIDWGGSTYIPECIQTSWVTDLGDAPLGCRDLTVTDCHFGPSDTLGPPYVAMGNHSAALNSFTRDVKFLRNTLEGCSYAGLRPFCWQNAKIVGNTFLDCNIWITSVADVRNGSGVATGTPQSNEDILIANNTFIDVNNAVIGCSRAGGENTTSYAKVLGLKIINNTIKDTVAYSEPIFELWWADDVVVTGNTHRGTRARAITQRFCYGVTVAHNKFDKYTIDVVTLDEATEAHWAGQGLSGKVSYSNNTMNGAGYFAFNLQGAVTGVEVTNNIMSGIGDPNPRAAIRLMGGIDQALVEGNIIDGSNGGVTIGVDIRADATNVTVGYNQIIGNTAAAYAHSGTGRLNAGGAGVPTGNIIAPVGSTWCRSDGGAGTSFYVKESGGGAATGWAVK